MSVMFRNGRPLFANGRLAMDPRCCCTVDLCFGDFQSYMAAFVMANSPVREELLLDGDILRPYLGAVGWHLRMVAEVRTTINYPGVLGLDCYQCSIWHFVYDGCIAEGADTDMTNTLEIAWNQWLSDYQNVGANCFTGAADGVSEAIGYFPFESVSTTNATLRETLSLGECISEGDPQAPVAYHFQGNPRVCPCQ